MSPRPSSLIVAAVIALSAAAATTQVFAVAEESAAPACVVYGAWQLPPLDAAAAAPTPGRDPEQLALVDKSRRRHRPPTGGNGPDPPLFSAAAGRVAGFIIEANDRSPPMMRSLWISKTGMEAQQTQLDAISHNLANASTNGYKKSHAVFEDLMYQNLRQSGANTTEQDTLPTGLQLGLGTRAVATSRNFSQGALAQTTNPLDVAINGNGFFQLQMPDGTTGYTRDGSFQVNAQGTLVTNNGLTVQPGITIPANAVSVTIGNDGTVSATLPTQAAPQVVGKLSTASFINPAGLDPKGQNIYAETAASGNATSGTPGLNGLGTLQQGFVESSNVNVVEELVGMIQTQRAYELNSKAIKTSDDMLASLAQL